MGWNDRFHTLGKHQLYKRLGRVASVSQQMVEIETINQCLSLGHIVTMSTCKAKTQRITQAIDRDMDLRTESATATDVSTGWIGYGRRTTL